MLVKKLRCKEYYKNIALNLPRFNRRYMNLLLAVSNPVPAKMNLAKAMHDTARKLYLAYRMYAFQINYTECLLCANIFVSYKWDYMLPRFYCTGNYQKCKEKDQRAK